MQKGGKDGWVWQNERLVLVVGDRQELAVLLLVLTRALTIKNWAWVAVTQLLIATPPALWYMTFILASPLYPKESEQTPPQD